MKIIIVWSTIIQLWVGSSQKCLTKVLLLANRQKIVLVKAQLAKNPTVKTKNCMVTMSMKQKNIKKCYKILLILLELCTKRYKSWRSSFCLAVKEVIYLNLLGMSYMEQMNMMFQVITVDNFNQITLCFAILSHQLYPNPNMHLHWKMIINNNKESKNQWVIFLKIQSKTIALSKMKETSSSNQS